STKVWLGCFLISMAVGHGLGCRQCAASETGSDDGEAAGGDEHIYSSLGLTVVCRSTGTPYASAMANSSTRRVGMFSKPRSRSPGGCADEQFKHELLQSPLPRIFLTQYQG